MPYERDPNELGALWEKTGAKGPYMTGALEINGTKVPVVVFKNGNKRGNAPDWRVLKATKRAAQADEDEAF